MPTSPYTSVEILSQKDLFRRYLAEHNFNVPKYVGCTSYTEAFVVIKNLTLPVMIKPVDSSGSKGINKLTNVDQLKDFIEDALSYSREKRIIIEEFIEKDGYQISGDAFSVDGILKFHCFGNEYYSSSVVKDFAPLGECWPFQMKPEIITELEKDIQRLISELKMGTTAYNVEAILGKNGKLYILELGARSGGSLIPQITELATGVNMVKYVIKAALGEDCSEIEMSPARGYWSNYMLHSKQTGRFKEISFDENFAKAAGTRANAYNLLIAVVIAVIIVLAMNLVGSLLISALVIFPALSAMRLFKSFRSVTISAAVMSVFSAAGGILISILAGTPVGSTIVAVDIAVFLASYGIGKILGR